MRSLGVFFIMNFICATALGAGYEKNGLWGAKAAALGGVGSLDRGTAESLYYNPAGVAGSRYTFHSSLSLSPTQAQLSGPFNNNNDVVESDGGVGVAPSFIVAYHVNSRLALSAGMYAFGGGAVSFSGVQFDDFDETVDLKNDVRIAETSIGISYRLTRKLSLGLAWRLLEYEANFNWPSRAMDGFVLATPKFEDVKGSDASAYRIGTIYDWNRRHRSSFVYRSQANIQAQGRLAGGKAATPVVDLDLDPGTVQYEIILPQSITLGHASRLNKHWKLYGEYNWTEYSKSQSMNMQTTSVLVGNQQQELGWSDQHILRLGVENYHLGLPLRFGLSRTSSVTSMEDPSPLATPPGETYSIAAGVGLKDKFDSWAYRLDFGFEYSFVGAEAGSAQPGENLGDARQGLYNMSLMAFHISAGLLF